MVAATGRLSRALSSEGDAYARCSLATDPDVSIDKKAGELSNE
ncbi:hypothetical protein ACSNOI_40585 [Actinomadura kijaniata]